MKTYLIRLHLIIFGRIFVFLRGLTGDGERSAAAEIWELAYRACRVAGEEECSTGAKNLNVIRHGRYYSKEVLSAPRGDLLFIHPNCCCVCK